MALKIVKIVNAKATLMCDVIKKNAREYREIANFYNSLILHKTHFALYPVHTRSNVARSGKQS